MALGILTLAAPAVAKEQSAATEDWYLVEFAANRPVCGNTSEPSNANCWETDSRFSRFEMRDGETLTMPTSTTTLPAWVALRQIWVVHDGG